jgi:acyl carrier protein
MSQEDALKWIAELFEESPDGISADTPRSSVPAWDSLGVLTLMASLDETFDLVVSDDDMQAMQKIGDILDLLRRHGKLAA